MNKPTLITVALLALPAHADLGLATLPSAYEQQQSKYRQKPVKQRQPVYRSRAAYPPSTDGKCVKNKLGTRWPGIHGYATPQDKRKCEGL